MRRCGICLAVMVAGLVPAASANADAGLVTSVLQSATSDPVNFVAGTAEGTPALILSKVAIALPAPSTDGTPVRKAHRRKRLHRR
jgi:hypothetical protein